MPEGTDLPRFDALTLTGNTSRETERAARTVRDGARNADDARFLLQVLGLIPSPPPVRPSKKHAAPPATTTADAPINTRQEVNP